MKETIAIWGEENEKEILVAIKLMLNKDKVKIWTFEKANVSDEFYTAINGKWAEGFEDSFTNKKEFIERNISEENLLPDHLKTKKTDVVKIAEQEWRVRVISFKLFKQTESQIDELKTRCAALDVYSKTLWDECVNMSNKLKDFTLDRTLPKEYITTLRNNLDKVFDDMKALMSTENNKFTTESNDKKEEYVVKIKAVTEEALAKNNGKKGFDQLITLQQELKGIDLLAKHRSELRKVFNTAFDAIKAKRNAGFKDKLGRRIEGLEAAIKKMENSIKQDKNYYSGQTERLERTANSQLEYQLRGAKLKLVEEKINSKGEKLHDMYTLLKELKAKDAKIKVAAPKVEKPKTPKTEKAAEPKADKKAEAPVANKASEKENTVASTKAVASVAATNVIVDKVEAVKEKVDAKVETASDKVETITEKVEAKAETVTEKVETKVEAVTEKIAEKVETVAEKVENKVENVVEESTKIVSEPLTENAVSEEE